jgi:hypothetical protein
VPHPDPPPLAHVANNSDPAINHIHIEYHHSSGKPSETLSYKEYDPSQSQSQSQSSAHRVHAADPWWPFFNTCEDFLFSEVLCKGSMSNEQMDNLLKIIKWCLSGKGSLTFSSHADI